MVKNYIIILPLIICLCMACSTNKAPYKFRLKEQPENLQKITSILNMDIPNYKFKMSAINGFYLNNEKDRIIGADIFDLNEGKRIDNIFKNGHIYHIFPINFENSFSYILCVFDNKMTLFSSINCKDRGDNLEKVMNFVKNRVSAQTLENLKNYRSFGHYIKIDSMSEIKCDCSPCG